MDRTERKITKISRTAQRFTSHVLKDFGLGTSEYELIHCVRHNPGISQAKISEKLKLDKAAVARCVAGLIKKDYLVTQPDPQDKRGKMVFATAKSEIVKNSKSDVESFYYEWLTHCLLYTSRCV